MAGGMDFWRPPMADLPDSDEEGLPGRPQEPAPSSAAADAFAPPPRVAQAQHRRWSLELRADWTAGSFSKSSLSSTLDIDDAAVKAASYPVKLCSLNTYLQALRVVDQDAKEAAGGGSLVTSPQPVAAQLSGRQPVAVQELAGRWATAKLEQALGEEVVPEELLNKGGLLSQWSSLLVDGHEALHRPASAPQGNSWKALLEGALQAPETAVTGELGPVPQLPNPFTVATDCPALLEQMLKGVPKEERDVKCFRQPVPIEGLPELARGPGGLLLPNTPKQLAQNQLAAAILNRLSGNLLISLSQACREHAAQKRVPPEVHAVEAAKLALNKAAEALQKSIAEDAAAQSELKAFLASYEADPERQRHLEGVVGWKSSARAQSESELEEARKALREAEGAKVAAFSVHAKSMSWAQRWPSLVPAEVSSDEFFGVRLAEGGSLCYTLRDFVEAMQSGYMNRAQGGMVPKHSLEFAFVRSAADSLLLCSPAEKGSYLHLPAPATVGTGLLDAASSGELQALRPQHAAVLRMEGQTFPFSVVFGTLGAMPLGFYGLGVHALTFNTPWNNLEYADVLWAREAQEAITHIPLIAVLSSLVSDSRIALGPFAPVPEGQSAPSRLPGAAAGLALLQAALFNDVKMWPVSLPHQARARWDCALRALKVVLAVVREEVHKSSGPRLPGVDDVRDGTLARCLEALCKVPDDGTGSGGTPAMGGALGSACGGCADRLKRMELSLLESFPLRGAQAVKKQLEELQQLWPKFEEETAAASIV
eukprot:TRINITY_DN27257_c0_g2_i1.p1 TRINITY_DN27257_c0_g2~~TRINITY_DN27257_c0_g2_i1.p1  ORF type:complete len:766 (-),score=184.68 TRINITY_DN27257_c0_g2_i1:73-2370(-)